MDIAQTTSTQATTPTKPTAEPDSAGSMISSDFETFLRMLTVQMENQDPLNPIESSDYAVQLATFSGVEQQVKTNDLLAAVSDQLGAMGMTDLATWIGMDARAAAPVRFDQSPISLKPDPASGAERALLVVRDAAGKDVDRIDIPVSDQEIDWAGVDATGAPFPPGNYAFFLQSWSNDEILAEDPVAAYSEIVEARAENGKTILVLQSGAEVAASDVDALRAPAPSQ